MFKVNRSLLNVNFEGYKLAQQGCDLIHVIDLPSPVHSRQADAQSSQFQVLADELYRNDLWAGKFICLQDGSILELDDEGKYRAVGKHTINEYSSFSASYSGFYCLNNRVFSEGKEEVTLALRFPDHPFTLTCSNEAYLTGYQTVLAEDLRIMLPESKKNSYVFLVSLFKGEGALVAEYISYGRPRIAEILDDNLLLGSSTGFTLLGTGAPDFLTESTHLVLEDRLAEEVDEEEAEEEASLIQAIIKTFPLSAPNECTCTSPPITLLGVPRQEDVFYIATQTGVDMAVFRTAIAQGTLTTEHVYTQHAFAFVQSGKPRRKYIAFTEGMAVIAEVSDTIYVYKLRSLNDLIADQYLIDLRQHAASGSPIIGISLQDGALKVLLEDKVIVYSNC